MQVLSTTLSSPRRRSAAIRTPTVYPGVKPYNSSSEGSRSGACSPRSPVSSSPPRSGRSARTGQLPPRRHGEARNADLRRGGSADRGGTRDRRLLRRPREHGQVATAVRRVDAQSRRHADSAGAGAGSRSGIAAIVLLAIGAAIGARGSSRPGRRDAHRHRLDDGDSAQEPRRSDAARRRRCRLRPHARGRSCGGDRLRRLRSTDRRSSTRLACARPWRRSRRSESRDGARSSVRAGRDADARAARRRNRPGAGRHPSGRPGRLPDRPLHAPTRRPCRSGASGSSAAARPSSRSSRGEPRRSRSCGSAATWKVASFRSSPGPTPPLAASAATPAGELFAAVPEFEEFKRARP